MKGSKSQPRLRGQFITSGSRKLVGLEIAKTHFHMGNEVADYRTTSQKMFAMAGETPKPAEPAEPSRTTNISLREPGRPQIVAGNTEMQWRYQPYDVASAVTRPDESLRADLRKHHFKLGTTSVELKSTTQATFTPQLTGINPQQQADIEKLKHTIRTHSKIFDSGTLPQQGLSHEQYAPKVTESYDISAARNAHRTRNQKANFRVGSYPMEYESVTARDYGPKSSPTIRLKPAASSSFYLGNEPSDFATVSRATFSHFPQCRQPLSTEAQADLQKTHFLVGNEPCHFESSSHALMKCDVPVSPMGRPSSRNRKSNFVFGNDHPQWKTMYSLTHSEKVCASVKPLRDRHTDKESHFALGEGDQALPDSVARSDYKSLKGAEANHLPAAITADIRQHHFQVGTDKQEWALVSARYGSEAGRPGKIDPDRLKDIKSEHFRLGFGPRDFTTTSKAQESSPGLRNSLDPSALKRLKGTNALLGTSPGDYDTTYSNAYLWVQPEPDSCFKLTMR